MSTPEPVTTPALEKAKALYAQSCELDRKLLAATREAFPKGTLVEATLGRNRIRGHVTGHSDFCAGDIFIENCKTGRVRRFHAFLDYHETRVLA